MNALKFIVVASALAMFSQPVLAEGSKMDHSKMDHGAHEHAGMEKPDLGDEVIAANAVLIVAKVNGLVCDFCAQALKKVFKKEEAVDSLNVDLDAGEVSIALKQGQSLSDERVKKLIRKSGYSLVSTERVISQ
ncbi:MAG: heavy-metal-associated domain-containing protein [Gammaproteobacteria bacterium]